MDTFQADSTLAKEKRQFNKEAMEYVMTLQEVQDRKKFEFVEVVRKIGSLSVVGPAVDIRISCRGF